MGIFRALRVEDRSAPGAARNLAAGSCTWPAYRLKRWLRGPQIQKRSSHCAKNATRAAQFLPENTGWSNQ